MRKTKVTTRGRVTVIRPFGTIPADLRKKHKIKPGTKIVLIDEGNGIRLQPVNKKYIRSLIGKRPPI